MAGGEKIESTTVDLAEAVLKESPLCDRCLGRLFAKLGYGWDNKSRGEALKRVIVMRYHERIRRGSEQAREEFRVVAGNIGEPARALYANLFGENLQEKACAICGGILDQFIEKASAEAAALLKAYRASTFLVGVVCDKDVVRREEEIARRHGLDFWESIKNEIKREVGKRVQQSANITPDFRNPQITLVVRFPEGTVDIVVSSMLIKGRYWKTGRMISQAFWPTIGGPRYFSLEDAAVGVLSVTGGETVVVHASGREDVDARMLGSGRPLVVEVKAPRVWEQDLASLEEALNKMSRNVVKFKVEGLAEGREVVRVYKEEQAVRAKTYKALVAVEGALGDDDVSRLESTFSGATVFQKTPKRVLRRKKEALRVKSVERVVCRRVTENVIECLIRASGGLYIKELVSGDDGRTSPSFAEVLGKKAYCVELDVVEVDALV